MAVSFQQKALTDTNPKYQRREQSCLVPQPQKTNLAHALHNTVFLRRNETFKHYTNGHVNVIFVDVVA